MKSLIFWMMALTLSGIDLMKSIAFVKLANMMAIRSLMNSMTVPTTSLTLLNTAFTILRNFSLCSYAYMNADTSAVTAAITRPMGPRAAVNAGGSIARRPNTVLMMLATGEIAATSPAMTRMNAWVGPCKFPNHSNSLARKPTTFSSTGTRVCARDAPAFKRSPVRVAFNLSIASLNSLADATPSSERMIPASSASFPYALRDAPPSSMIPASSAAERPNNSCARMSLCVSF